MGSLNCWQLLNLNKNWPQIVNIPNRQPLSYFLLQLRQKDGHPMNHTHQLNIKVGSLLVNTLIWFYFVFQIVFFFFSLSCELYLTDPLGGERCSVWGTDQQCCRRCLHLRCLCCLLWCIHCCVQTRTCTRWAYL